jgi:hypothetical protein
MPLGGFDHLRATRDNLHPNFVPAFGEFDKEPLAETIMRGSQKENAHGILPCSGWFGLKETVAPKSACATESGV